MAFEGLDTIGQIHVSVTDVDRAVAFYRDVLEMRFLFQVPGQPMAFFDCGGVRLYLGRPESPDFRSNPVLYFTVEDVHEAHAALLERGVEFVHGPHVVNRTETSELWMAFFRDPDGNNLAIMTEMPSEPSGPKTWSEGGLDPAVQRRVAVELFNETWTLMERPDRDPAEDPRMLHMAHASRFHWGEIGEPVNLARGEWLCSRVYAVLGRAEPARYHAGRCLDICEGNGIGDFDIAYAHEALARALRLAGDLKGFGLEAARAHDLADAIAEEDDREHFLDDLADLLG